MIVVEPTATGVTTPVAGSTVATDESELDHETVPVLFEDGADAVNAPSTSKRSLNVNAPNDGVVLEIVNTAKVEPSKYAADSARVNVIVVEPTATDVTTPVTGSTVATDRSELDQEAAPVLFDDGAVAVNAPSTSKRSLNVNAPNDGVARVTVNTAVVKPGKYSADSARVNVIVVEPTATGVTTPVTGSTVATDGSELDQETVPVLFEDGAVAVNAPSTS